MKHVNWGIIGCGDVTEQKSGPAFQKVPHSQIIGVMRRNAEKAKDYALRHKVPKWYADADQLINDPDINAIYVATPPQSHADYAIRSMKAGKPVYVEKPMAASYSDCLAMNKVSAETGVPLFVAYYRRSLSYFLKVKELIDQNVIGSLLTLQCRLLQPPRKEDYRTSDLPWRVLPDIAGGGYFYDLACHTLDMLDFIFGPMENIQGIVRNLAGLYPAEDTVAASFSFKNGLVGQGTWCFAVHESSVTDTVEILGVKGRITFSTYAFMPVTVETEEGVKTYRPQRPEHIQQPMIEQVVAALRGEGHSPSDGISGARTNFVMDMVLNKQIPGQEILFKRDSNFK